MTWRAAFYRFLLRLYPAGFREQFEEEMLEVFEKSQEEALMRSSILRESIGAIGGAIRER